MPALALTFWRHNSKRQLRKAEKLKRNLEFYIKDRVSITKKKSHKPKKQQLKAIANNKIIEIATTKLVAVVIYVARPEPAKSVDSNVRKQLKQ